MLVAYFVTSGDNSFVRLFRDKMDLSDLGLRQFMRQFISCVIFVILCHFAKNIPTGFNFWRLEFVSGAFTYIAIWIKAHSLPGFAQAWRLNFKAYLYLFVSVA